ncbi:MAG: hypothetical protein WDO74_03620 [Pseudomonadota bacterium]
MRDKSGIWRVFAQCLTGCVCSSLVACGSSDDGGSAAAVLRQAPHCPADSDALKIQGTIAGAAIDDSRTTEINAGLENFMGGRFDTPFFDLAPLPGNQLALTFTWPGSLFYGQTASITGGNITLPNTHPQAGAKYCLSAGQVGFVDGGTEDGALKFSITEVKAGADCSGPATAIDLRGCYQ